MKKMLLIVLLILTACNSQKGEITDEKGVEMILIPEGIFVMGSDDAIFDHEKPAHQVNLDAYYIDKYEVTNSLYKICVDEGICDQPVNPGVYTDPQFAQYPVTFVKWQMAVDLCEWRGARLPTEAEWEKAARGTDERAYPWGNEFGDGKANFCDGKCVLAEADKDSDDGYEEAAPVGSYPEGVSPYGVYDMAGNVWEWVADWADIEYYASSPETNPLGPENGKERVMRGGSWHDDQSSLRSVARAAFHPSLNLRELGIRCARDVSQ